MGGVRNSQNKRNVIYGAPLINHSGLVPNLKRIPIEGGNPKRPRLILVARRDIEPGEELLYDFGIKDKDHPFTLT